MIIKKILNNNVVVTTNDNKEEIIVMGKGLAYGKQVMLSILERLIKHLK